MRGPIATSRSHPEPDSMGRWRCTACGEFTADTGRIHGWCRTGMAVWAAQWVSKNTQRGRGFAEHPEPLDDAEWVKKDKKRGRVRRKDV